MFATLLGNPFVPAAESLDTILSTSTGASSTGEREGGVGVGTRTGCGFFFYSAFWNCCWVMWLGTSWHFEFRCHNYRWHLEDRIQKTRFNLSLESRPVTPKLTAIGWPSQIQIWQWAVVETKHAWLVMSENGRNVSISHNLALKAFGDSTDIVLDPLAQWIFPPFTLLQGLWKFPENLGVRGEWGMRALMGKEEIAKIAISP